MPSYLGGRFRALQMSRVGWVVVAIIRPSTPTLSCALTTHASRQCPSKQGCVCQVSVRAPSVALTRRPPTVWPAFRGHPPPLSLPVSPHMRPRCRRESPLSHGLLLFRFPLSAAACALPIRRRFFRKALLPRYRSRRCLLLISYGIRIPPFPAAFSHPL